MHLKMLGNAVLVFKLSTFLSIFFPLFTITQTAASKHRLATISQTKNPQGSPFHSIKEYPLNQDAENNAQEFPLEELLTPLTEDQEEPLAPLALTPQPVTIVVNQETITVQPEKTTCTNSKIRALATGFCLGSIMGVLKYQTRRFFPTNWIVGFFLRILLVEAITTPCTAPNKDLMHESARAADWLVYGYIRLHTLHIL